MFGRHLAVPNGSLKGKFKIFDKIQIFKGFGERLGRVLGGFGDDLGIVLVGSGGLLAESGSLLGALATTQHVLVFLLFFW